MYPGSRWLWDYVPGNSDDVDFVNILSPADRFPGYGKLLGYYPKYAWLGLKAWPRQKGYNAVVAWEGKNGVPLAFLRAVTGRHLPPLIILNFVLKGQVVLNALGLMRLAMRGANYLTCVSTREVTLYNRVLRLPPGRLRCIPTVLPDHHRDANACILGDYVLAAGRSHRDYATLLEAARGLPVKVIVTGRSFNFRHLEPPDNVTLLPFVAPNLFRELVRGALFAVVPLFEAQHASGETFLLEAMSARKAVIATRTFSTVEFVRPGSNGLLVEPGDAAGLHQAMLSLLANPQRAAEMGRQARLDYEANWSLPVVARQVVDLVQAVASGHALESM